MITPLQGWCSGTKLVSDAVAIFPFYTINNTSFSINPTSEHQKVTESEMFCEDQSTYSLIESSYLNLLALNSLTAIGKRVLTEVPTMKDVNHFESKKARLDSNTSNAVPESCVLHVRGLPPDITEHEVTILAIPFGSIANMILTKKNCQALIEMDTLESAESMFGYYTTVCPPKLRGKYPVEIQFSRYASLSNSNTNNATVSAIEEANKQFAKFRSENEESPKTVLHIQVERLFSPTEIGYLPFFLVCVYFSSYNMLIIIYTALSYLISMAICLL
ncbi:unnamed protein product [Heterobilharzia americana]|nr:unnamed protein product [Heterobilharzia americana]